MKMSIIEGRRRLAVLWGSGSFLALLVLVVDGTIHDTFRPDPFRCIYGAWELSRDAEQNEPSRSN